MKVEKTESDKFILPKTPKFVLVITFIPAYMGADNPPFIQFFNKVEAMEEVIKRIEKTGSVSDMYITHVVKEKLYQNR